jgi:hypothetical protein
MVAEPPKAARRLCVPVVDLAPRLALVIFGQEKLHELRSWDIVLDHRFDLPLECFERARCLLELLLILGDLLKSSLDRLLNFNLFLEAMILLRQFQKRLVLVGHSPV